MMKQSSKRVFTQRSPCGTTLVTQSFYDVDFQLETFYYEE